ncbi:MAG: hypothetical protein K8T90_08765 [Planctomycetes bacterium]|nr:hypothetical protein [Planctomycetota bacterium]
MTRYAVPLHDLDAVWRTPSGAALVDLALDAQRAEDAEVVDVEGTEALVLRGPSARTEALASGLAATAFPAPAVRTARVFANDGDGWRRISAADLADRAEVAAREGGRRTRAPSRPGPERASFARACRFHTSGIGD